MQYKIYKTLYLKDKNSEAEAWSDKQLFLGEMGRNGNNFWSQERQEPLSVKYQVAISVKNIGFYTDHISYIHKIVCDIIFC